MPSDEGYTFGTRIHGAMEALDGWDDFPFDVQMTYVELAHLADFRTGIYGTTRNALALRWKIHPETLGQRLDALKEKGLVFPHFPRGSTGSILIVHYAEVVHLRPQDAERVREAQAKWYAQRAKSALRSARRRERQRGSTGVVVDLATRRANAGKPR